MIYSLQPIKVMVNPGCWIHKAITEAKALSGMLSCEVQLIFNGRVYIINGDSVKEPIDSKE